MLVVVAHQQHRRNARRRQPTKLTGQGLLHQGGRGGIGEGIAAK